MNRYCLFALIAFVALGALAALSSFAFLDSGGEGENPTGSSVSQGKTANINLNPGGDCPLRGSIPKVLAELFVEACGRVGTSAGLLAAISQQECGRLWSVSVDKLKTWIDNDQDIQEPAICASEIYSGALGPMQFLASTFKSYAAQTARLTDHSPASRGNIKDSIYAAALKLFADAGRPLTWTERKVRIATKRYLGECNYEDKRRPGVVIHYCDDIVQRWQQLSGS